MSEIRFTLLSEGSSDKVLLAILRWLLQQHFEKYEIQAEWADLSRLPNPPKTLDARIHMSLELYPCDVLFVHRDADNQGWEKRWKEISQAWELINKSGECSASLVPVIPIRMTEAWLLFDKGAIRRAASNPRGQVDLDMPTLKTLEGIPNPKLTLQNLLKRASEASGRKLKRFNERSSTCVVRIADSIDDFSPLRSLTAFQRLEGDIRKLALSQTGLEPGF
ncbi:MAG: hypothetical protein ACFCU9_02715 [Cyanophyceae cyanobacterium]